MSKISDSTFTVPAKHNPRLQTLVDRINADEELRQMWRCANVNAVDRLEMSDHGVVHMRIVANAALRLVRLLREAGYPASAVVNHHLAPEAAEVVVVLASALHDLGIVIHYERHAELGLPLARQKALALLAGLFPIREQTIIIAEILHAIMTHHDQARCLTLEAGILKLADALDMTAGRLRPAAGFNGPTRQMGNTVVGQVLINKGEAKPVQVELRMSRTADLRQIEDALQQKLQHSPLFGLVEVVTRTEHNVPPLYELETQ